jgi:antirestriction protein
MEQKTAALNAVMEQGKAVSKLETDALAADADFHDAKQKMVDAKAAMDKLMAGFEATIKDKPEWQAAKAAVDTAEADVKKAKDDLVAAQQADAQAAADYQTQLAAWQKSGGGGGGGPKMPKVSK